MNLIANKPLSPRHSNHKADKLPALRKLKSDFGNLFFDADRYAQLVAKQEVGNATKDEQSELATLKRLRRWKCGCVDCETI